MTQWRDGHLARPAARTPARSIVRKRSDWRLSLEVLNELHQTTHCNSRWAFRDPGLGFFRPRRAGDVEMQPRGVFGELLQEHGGGDGAAPAAPGVHDVGDARLDDLFVFVVERHAPEF